MFGLQRGGSAVIWSDRQGEMEGAALAWPGALGPDPATLEFYQAPGNGQADTAATAGDQSGGVV